MSSSDDDDHASDSVATDAAVAIIVAPNPAPGTIETPANVAPDEARPPSNIAELNPVPKAITPSLTATTSMLAGFGYNFSSGEDRQPVDEQCEILTISALRQVATHLGTPTDAQNRNKLLLRKFIIKQLHALGMIVQEDLEFFFAPALAAQPEVRADGPPEDLAANDGSPEDLAASAELKQAAMLRQLEDLQRQLTATQASVDAPGPPKVPKISGLAAVNASCSTPIFDSAANLAAPDAFEVDEYTEVALAILRSRSSFGSLSKLKFPDQDSKFGSFLGSVLRHSSETALLTVPPKAAVLSAFLMISRLKDVELSALVASVPPDTRQLAYTERNTTGPIPREIQNPLLFQLESC